jgi:hypothetical protein
VVGYPHRCSQHCHGFAHLRSFVDMVSTFAALVSTTVPALWHVLQLESLALKPPYERLMWSLVGSRNNL